LVNLFYDHEFISEIIMTLNDDVFINDNDDDDEIFENQIFIINDARKMNLLTMMMFGKFIL